MPKKFGNQNLNSEVSKMASQKKLNILAKRIPDSLCGHKK